MLDTYRIRSRIKEIRERITILEKYFKPISEQSFILDVRINAEAERHLEIAIQAAIDIASHIVAAFGLHRDFRATSEVFFVLAEERIIPRDFVDTLVKITGYRNVVVHQYMDIDRHETYRNIQENLSDLAKFAKYIENFLRKREKEKT